MNLLKGSANKGLSKLETPEILAEQAELQFQSTLKHLMEAIVTGTTNEKSLEGKIAKTKEELASWEKRAALAVQQNADELARQCLQKKLEAQNNLQSMESQLQEQKANNQRFKSERVETEKKYEDFRRNKANLTGRLKAADGLSKANEILSKTSTSGVDKWEEKIRDKEIKAEALRDVVGGEAEIKAAGKAMELDDELAALKAQMQPAKAGDNSQIKLVVSAEKANSENVAAAAGANKAEDEDIIDVEPEP
jgi:phage shock protein A